MLKGIIRLIFGSCDDKKISNRNRVATVERNKCNRIRRKELRSDNGRGKDD